MLQFKLQILVLLLALPAVGFCEETPRDITLPETIELATIHRNALLAAPQIVMNSPPSADLSEAIQFGTVESVNVDKTTEKFTGEDAERIGRDTVTTYQGWIRYTSLVKSGSRQYQPVVLCLSHDEDINWVYCQDESWIRLQTANMQKPIRFSGDLSDEHVTQIFDVIDNAGLVSSTDDQPITSVNINQIIQYAYPGNCVGVFMTTKNGDCGGTYYLSQATNSAGHSEFKLSDFLCGRKITSR